MEKIKKMLMSIGNLDQQIKVYPDNDQIPLLFRKKVVFYEGNIYNRKHLIAYDTEDVLSVKSLQNLQLVTFNLGFDDLLYVHPNLTRLQRKRLRENQISYLDDKENFYLKSVSLLENGSERYEQFEKEKFSILAQQVFIYLLSNVKKEIDINDVSKFFHFSTMHASRALKELLSFGLLSLRIEGRTSRNKKYRINTEINYFRKGLELSQSPITKIIYTNIRPEKSLLSSESALAYLSLLSDPKAVQVALYRKEQIQEDPNGEYRCELWKYDPNFFGIFPCIDVFSLACLLKQNKDPRVQGELESILKKQEWYKD